MPAPLEHQVAYYSLTKGGPKQPILADDLPSCLEKMKELSLQGLLTDYEGTTQFAACGNGGGGNRPHFRVRPGYPEAKPTYAFENNKEHNKRVAELLDALQGKDWTVQTGSFSNPELVCTLAGYQWSAETHRIASARGTLRHDIFGQSVASNAMSIHRPNVAIEVVNCHWPDPMALEDMLDLSARTPFMVLFESTNPSSKLLKVDTHNGTLHSILYLSKGLLMKDGRPLSVRGTQLMTSPQLCAKANEILARFK
jgi:hypothetical protein